MDGSGFEPRLALEAEFYPDWQFDDRIASRIVGGGEVLSINGGSSFCTSCSRQSASTRSGEVVTLRSATCVRQSEFGDESDEFCC